MIVHFIDSDFMSYAQHGITYGYSGIAVFFIDVPDWTSQTHGYSDIGSVIRYDPYMSVRYPVIGVDTNSTTLALKSLTAPDIMGINSEKVSPLNEVSSLKAIR